MIDYGNVIGENKTKHKLNWPHIPDHLFRIIRGPRYEQTNALLSLIKHKDDGDYDVVDKIYLYINDLNEANYQCLIRRTWQIGLDHHKNPKALIEFDDTFADIISNKKINPIVTKRFIRVKKLNISITFTTHSYFRVPKDVRQNSKTELQQIAINHLLDIDKYLQKIHCRAIFFLGH